VEPQYGSYDGMPVRYTYSEAWMLVNGAWRRTSIADVLGGAAGLSRDSYHQKFGAPPPLPPSAFQASSNR
jgi:hypothetical protein